MRTVSGASASSLWFAWLLLCVSFLYNASPSHALASTSISLPVPSAPTNSNDLPKPPLSTNITTSNNSEAPPLLNFQVAEPVLTKTEPSSNDSVTQILMQHVFANSYGQPFVGSYDPPDCVFNRVTINFTVSSAGRQFDRLGLMYLGDVEVFRTSTAEPTPNGIIWTYLKEMDHYTALWKSPQKMIFDLPNIVDSTYTGPLNTTLTATFFNVPEKRPVADMVLPISARRSSGNSPSAFTVPSDNASVAYSFPSNVERAVISLSACGQQNEEFWYTNVLSSDTLTFKGTVGVLSGYSPFREVQLLIDGQLAGVSWPFPVIFTGGVVPGFWRPIAGIDAFELRQHEIDITPWLGYLCDGGQHTFEIRVVGLDDDGEGSATLSRRVGDYWVVTGTIFLFLGAQPSHTSSWMSKPRIDAPLPDMSISSSVTHNGTGGNGTLLYNVQVSRTLSITSHLSNSTQEPITWTQKLIYSNGNQLLNYGYTQVSQQTTTGVDVSSLGYSNAYAYPILVNSTYANYPQSGIQINGTFNHGLTYNIAGSSVFPNGIQSSSISHSSSSGNCSSTNTPASFLSTTQRGSASFLSAPATPNASYSFGNTSQDFSFQGLCIPLSSLPIEIQQMPDQVGELENYERQVSAVNATVVHDQETLLLGGTQIPLPSTVQGKQEAVDDLLFAPPAQMGDVQIPSSEFDVRAVLGRGPGKPRPGYARVTN